MHPTQAELLDLLLALDGVRQDPRFHPEGDALFHSLQVFDLARRATGDRTLWAAALLHDIGKPRSSTDGKPIVRVKASALELLLARDHAEPWARYLADGTIDGLDEVLVETDDEDDAAAPHVPGPYDGLLLDGPDEDAALPEPGEEEDPEQAYEPLPGFERFG